MASQRSRLIGTLRCECLDRMVSFGEAAPAANSFRLCGILQSSATVEAAEPTYFHGGFARLLLPLWGGGYVSMLLGTIVRL